MVMGEDGRASEGEGSLDNAMLYCYLSSSYGV